MIVTVQRADGARYQVYARKGGKKVYVGSFESKREAQSADEDHRVTQRKIATGELPPELDAKRTLDAASEDWLKSLKDRASRSHEGYSTRMKIYILPALGKVAISRLTKSAVMRWRDDQSARFAPATVNGSLTCLSSACSYFVDRGWIATNPCTGVERIERKGTVFPWIETREEITKLLLQCPDDVRDIVAVALGTGMRLDELLHLHHADIDLERRLIAVHRGRQGTVKSGKARWIPVLDMLLPVLRQRALRRAGSDLLFPGKDGRVRSKAGVQGAFKLAVKRAGLDPKLHPHSLRHTFASHWMMSGGCIFRLSRLLGHSSVAQTEKVYAHLAPTVWEQDYGRVEFHVPVDAPVYEFARGPNGRITDRRLVSVA
ncbi:MAG: site-specific integrase [Proteobacteria bacterium]|nr:site-specific integrase [Pseudomonadota bacterium]